MSKSCVHLKSGASFTIESLTAIKVHMATKTIEYNAADFTAVPIREKMSYTFIGQDKTYAVSGQEISYLELLN
jgi:hypothetical protein